MYLDPKKADLISEINSNKNNPTCRNFSQLLDILIAEVRVDNDTAGRDDFPVNKGRIDAYKTVKEYIEKGLPTPSRQS